MSSEVVAFPDASSVPSETATPSRDPSRTVQTRTPPAFRRRLDRYGPVALAGGSLLVAVAVLVHYSRRLWFFGDDFEFLLRRDLGNDLVRTLFTPHNEHWSTLPVLEFRVLYSWFGLRHYLPYALVVIALHVVVCVLLWMLLRRVGVQPWVAAGAVSVMAMLGAGAENTLWDFQSGFVGSVAFGIGAMVVAADRSRTWPRTLGVWALLVGSLMCSGIGIQMTIATFVLAWVRSGFRSAAVLPTLPAAVYVVWFAAIGHTGLRTGSLSATNLTLVPSYILTGLSNFFGQLVGVEIFGPVLLLLVIGGVLASHRASGGRDLAAAGLVSAVGLFALTGISRVQFGLDQARVSRYVYIAGVFLVPAIAYVVQRALTAARKSPSAIAVTCVFLVGVLLTGVAEYRGFAITRGDAIAASKAQILGGVDLVDSGAPTISDKVEPALNPDVRVSTLADTADKFPQGLSTPKDRLDAASWIQVGVRPAPWSLPAPTGAYWTGVDTPLGPSGCTSAAVESTAAALVLTVGTNGSSVSLEIDAAQITTYLTDDGITSGRAVWATTPGSPSYIASVRAGADLIIDLPDNGIVRVCR